MVIMLTVWTKGGLKEEQDWLYAVKKLIIKDFPHIDQSAVMASM